MTDREAQAMSPTRIYRFSIWLPLLVPVVVIIAYNIWITGLGLPKPSGFFDVALELLAYSALYGGLPYIGLASWATWWVGRQPEREIRRIMFLAPLLMLAVWLVACLVMGTIADRMRVWLSVATLGATVIIPLGYIYVTMAVLLRHWLGPRATEAQA